MQDEQDLEKEGWQVASVTGGQHLKRTLEMYQELGLRTRLEEVSPEECAGCTECYQSAGETIYRIYTRAKDGAAIIGDE